MALKLDKKEKVNFIDHLLHMASTFASKVFEQTKHNNQSIFDQKHIYTLNISCNAKNESGRAINSRLVKDFV